MLIKSQGTNYDVRYRPGVEVVLAHTLSCLPNPENDGNIQLDVHIDGVNAEIEDPERYTITTINFSPKKQNVLCKQTAEDPKLRELKELINQRSPENMKDLQKTCVHIVL